jgi:hypothetical protein
MFKAKFSPSKPVYTGGPKQRIKPADHVEDQLFFDFLGISF